MQETHRQAMLPVADRDSADWVVTEVDLGGVRYPYAYGNHCLDRIIRAIGQCQADRILLVTDDNVAALHGADLVAGLRRHAPVEVLSSAPGEGMKSYQTLARHLDRAVAAGATRRSLVVTFGGGVPGNLGGLVAALLFRGIRLVHIPTTTVAAMDSTISLKQAINSGYGKNHIGAYHAPQAIFTDVTFLQTLPARESRSGLCEAAKNCLAIRPQAIGAFRQLLTSASPGSAEMLRWLLDEGLAAKIAVTAQDSREQRSGLVLEYGHTVGHAVELCGQALGGAAVISHGEAVALGMRAAARVAASLGVLAEADVAIHDELAGLLGVTPAIPAGISVTDVIDRVRVDGKRGHLGVSGDEAAMVVLRGLGQPLGDPGRPLIAVPLDLIADAVADLSARPRLRDC